MPFQLSPGVNVSEIDLTTIIPAVASTDAAYCGQFQWGPVDEITLVNNQETLVSTFGKPNQNTSTHWFTASNFLDYGNKLHLVRVVDKDANTACESFPSGDPQLLIKNDTNYAQDAGEGPFGVNGTDYEADFGKWAAQFPGNFGNNLKVSVCDSYPGQFANAVVIDTANTIAGSKTIFLNSNTNFGLGDKITFRHSTDDDIAGTGAIVTSEVIAPTQIVPAETFEIVSFPEGIKSGPVVDSAGNGLSAVLNKAVSTTSRNVAIDRKWEFYDYFDQAPGTSAYAEARGSANDEIHIAISDNSGVITGVKGQPLETFANLSKASDAKTDDGSSNYYVNVINEKSKYIRFLNHPTPGDQIVPDGSNEPGGAARFWGNTAYYGSTPQGVVESFQSIEGGDGRAATSKRVWRPDNITLKGGNNGLTTSASAFILGYDMFADPEETDISMVLGGPASGTVANYIIESVAEKRKDCVAFISPERSDVVGEDTLSNKLTAVKGFRLGPDTEESDTINSKSSSYGVMDSGWKYQYDKFNDQYVWTPLNADVAGLCVQTDNSRDPWWSPAGLNRGHVKNVVKLAWNPQKAHRDELYKNGINPVVTIKGQGTVLYGDKTLLAKPSAFDRINVRRLFIVLEKAIATASKFTLFEFNDEFTRSQFRNMVEPFLRDVQGRRGIYDFKVVCDGTNNTGEVIDRNEFIGDIYIKPARSINFIQLNFVAVRTGVDFSEVVGKF
jgi:hypothetical protein